MNGEKSKRSLTVRMKHEDDCGMNEDSNLSHSVRASTRKTVNRQETTKTKDLQCTKTHALASTTLTGSPSVSSHFTHCWDFHSVLRVVSSIVVAVPIYSIF